MPKHEQLITAGLIPIHLNFRPPVPHRVMPILTRHMLLSKFLHLPKTVVNGPKFGQR